MKQILILIVGLFSATVHAGVATVPYQVPTNDDSLARYASI